MKTTSALAITLLTFIAASASAAPVTFDWAHVGNAGNAADNTGFGAVSYNYAISKHEVTNAQYTEFLNAVDSTGANSLALFNSEMAGNFGGIENTGALDGARYIAQAGREQNPVTFVSFFDAMRFTNWLHNGQGAGNTETGAYTIGSGLDEVRSASAKYWIPSEDEWYKAAYHDASAGTAGVYFDYATGSDYANVPVSDQPGDNPAAVNYYNDSSVLFSGFNDGYAVSGSKFFPNSTNPFTDVGAYSLATSPYGTFDQNGNVFEWNEAVLDSSFRGLRGGSWQYNWVFLLADVRGYDDPADEDYNAGFRVATVPEPSTMLMGAMASVGVLLRRRR
jgi:formylglycine-generating enzyme required for sulfatase activity